MDKPYTLLEFQYVDIDSVEANGVAICVVVNNTLIECDNKFFNHGNTDNLADACYSAISGTSRHLAAY